jgi:HPt (histidine-containing phosphotransfer) domain-containing protein
MRSFNGFDAMRDEPLQSSRGEDNGAQVLLESMSAMIGGICRPQEALDRLDGLTDLYADVVARFLDDTPGLLPALRTAINSGDMVTAHRAAHSLKGLAGMCGAVSVADVAAAVDRATQTDPPARLLTLLARLDGEMAIARPILAPYRAATR